MITNKIHSLFYSQEKGIQKEPMEFSELFKQTSNLCCFSPNALYLATAVQYRLVIRDAESLQIVHLFNGRDLIQDIQWSPDSEFILCANYKLGYIQLFSLRDEKWSGKIEEGLAGCTRAFWSPDSRHILSFSEFQLRLTVWSLVTKSAYYIQYPKFVDKGYAFRSDSKYFILAERVDCKDYVSIYDTQDWTMIKRWPVDSNDLENIAWSPDGRFIAIWESCLEYKMYIYYPDGRLVASYSAYDSSLGIKSAAWSPSSQFLAIGSFDQKVRFLNNYTWKPLIEFSHPQNLTPSDISFYREVDVRDYRDVASLSSWTQCMSSSEKIRYFTKRPPMTVPQIKVDPEKGNPKIGVGWMKFNCDGRLLLTRNGTLVSPSYSLDNMPNCIWIWDIIQLRQVALIQQLSPISMALWNPIMPESLIFSTGGSHLYTWNGESHGCDAIEVPAVNFHIQNMKWNADGKSIVLMDKEKFTVAFPMDEE